MGPDESFPEGRNDLRQDGVAPDDLYPLDVDRALKKLDTIKKDLVFVPTWGAMSQKLVDKQVTMALCVDNVLGDAFKGGANIAPLWDVTFWDNDAYVIPKGDPKKDEAVKAIKFFLQPEQQKAYAELGGNIPVRTDFDPSALKLGEGAKKFSPWAGPNRGKLVHLDTPYWVKNQEAVAAEYVKWQAG